MANMIFTVVTVIMLVFANVIAAQAGVAGRKLLENRPVKDAYMREAGTRGFGRKLSEIRPVKDAYMREAGTRGFGRKMSEIDPAKEYSLLTIFHRVADVIVAQANGAGRKLSKIDPTKMGAYFLNPVEHGRKLERVSADE